MAKELLTVEFRYYDKKERYNESIPMNKTVMIGIFNTLEEAINEGNKTLNILSKSFEIRVEDKFKLNHLFGTPKRLVTNTSYPTKGVQYFAKIKPLKLYSLEETISETFKAFDRCKSSKGIEQD